MIVPPTFNARVKVCVRPRFLGHRFLHLLVRTSIVLLVFIGGIAGALASTIQVPAGGDLQSALNSAQCGDTILVAAGASFTTSADFGFKFPAKSGGTCVGTAADTITVKSDSSALPASGQRVSIADAANMPKLITTGATPAVGFAPNSRYWKLIGLEITTAPNPQVYTQFLVFIGTDIALSQVPSDITFDRCYIHSQEDGTNNPHASTRAGIDVHARAITFTGCRIAVPAGYSGPSQNVDNNYAVLMGKGPGPLTIDNCFINSWYSGLFLGGSTLDTTNTATVAAGATLAQATLSNVNNLNVGDLIALKNQNSFYEVAKVTGVVGNTITYAPWAATIGGGSPLTSAPIAGGLARWNGIVPSNVTLTRNTFWINPAIAAQIGSETAQYPKGWFEVKSADGLYLEGNNFTGWPANLALTVRNQGQVSGCDSPWSTIRHFTFKSNRIGNLATAHTVQLFNLQMEDNICTSSIGSDVKIVNNLLTSGGWIADLIGGSDITFRHNTVLNDGAGGWANGRLLNGINPVTNLVFSDNVAYNNEYGLSPQAPYNWGNIWPGIQMGGNVLLNEVFDPYRPNCSNLYPLGNFCPATKSAIGFTDMANGNYRLSPGSPYRLKASDGTDPGIDQDALEAAMGGAIATPTPTPTPTPIANSQSESDPDSHANAGPNDMAGYGKRSSHWSARGFKCGAADI